MTPGMGFLLTLLLVVVSPQLSKGQTPYDELAANFGASVTKILSLGGTPDDACMFAFNATQENCEALIENYETNNPGAPECDCYNFCQGEIAGCFAEGETPPLFQCDIYDVVAGCQKGEDKKSPLSPKGNASVPCPKGHMCSQDKERSCEEIRDIPIKLGLGDVMAGIYCPGRDDRSDNGMQNCEIGHYCPNSTSQIPCPKGFYCPYKVSTVQKKRKRYLHFNLCYVVFTPSYTSFS